MIEEKKKGKAMNVQIICTLQIRVRMVSTFPRMQSSTHHKGILREEDKVIECGFSR